MGPLIRVVSDAEPEPPLPAGPVSTATVALLEAVDRDGSVRQAWRVERWPLNIGRGLDNDVVLTDPHVAARHATLDWTAGGEGAGAALVVDASGSRNGLTVGRERIAGGTQARIPDQGRDLDLHIGRAHLRLRLPAHALAPEMALAPLMSRELGWLPTAGLATLVLALMLGNTWLDTDPDGLSRTLGVAAIGTLGAAALWCGLWSLLSKVIARQSSFGWHVRVFVVASLALLLLGVLPPLLAFALSWPWVTDFAFIAVYAALATTIYFHLLAVEPGRQRLMQGVAITGFAVAVALQLWFNVQRTGRLGEELYMNHLFPPQLRVARPVPVDRFVDGLAPIQSILDKQAREPASGDGGAGGSGDDEE